MDQFDVIVYFISDGSVCGRIGPFSQDQAVEKVKDMKKTMYESYDTIIVPAKPDSFYQEHFHKLKVGVC